MKYIKLILRILRNPSIFIEIGEAVDQIWESVTVLRRDFLKGEVTGIAVAEELDKVIQEIEDVAIEISKVV